MRKAVLFIHGLSAKKEDNQYFIDEMKKYPNIDMFSFTLPGHENDKVTKVKYKMWIDKSEEELLQILKKYKKVIIVSHSMGTIIAINLASRYKEVSKLVLISPAFIFGNIKQNKEDLKNLLNNKVDIELGTGFEGFFKKFVEVPALVMYEYKKMAFINKKNISKIKCPTLIIHGNADNVIPVSSSEYVYNNLKCQKDIVIVDKARHQVFKSIKKKNITKYIYKFITFNILYFVTKKKVI